MLWSDIYTFSLFAFSSVFFVVNPISGTTMFAALTTGWGPRERNRAALHACVAATLTLIAFLFAGGLIFRLFHVTLGAFRLAGGILLLRVGMDMLHGKASLTRMGPEDEQAMSRRRDIAITPMGIPQMAGPGAIATVMILPGNAREPWKFIPVVGAILLTSAATYFLLRASDRIMRWLGPMGARIPSKIMGLMTATMAVQFMALGLRDLLPTILEQVAHWR